MIVTIDGPAGTGKSTVARLVAQRLGFAHFDTGAMYRAVTLAFLEEKLDLGDAARIGELLERFAFEVRLCGDSKIYFMNGRDVTEALRTREVTQHVSPVSALPEVRRKLVASQRKMATTEDAVFDGRDLGTVVFPQADLKIFLTARPEVRARRRYEELVQKGTDPRKLRFDEVLQDINRRDAFDSSRAVSPLKPAADSVTIDTSDLTIQQVVDQIVALAKRGDRQ